MNEKITNKAQIDCYGTDEIVCPHCGVEWGDSWENGLRHDGPQEHSGLETCDECGQEYRWEREITASYTTTIPTPSVAALGGGVAGDTGGEAS